MRLEMGPIVPSPIVRSSTDTTGTTSTPVPQMNTSRAAQASNTVNGFSATGTPRSAARSITVSRLTALRVAGSARHDETDVAVDDLVAAAGLGDDLADLGGSVRDLEADRLGRIEQPLDVAFELEDTAVVRADPLEDTVAVKQAVVEDVHAC